MEEQANIDLGPIYEPTPVAFEFVTLGWKVVAILITLMLTWTAIVFTKRYIKNAYRREAVRLLTAIQDRFKKENEVECVNDTMILLKQVSLKAYPREEVAKLHGDKWLEFLNSSSKHVDFSVHTNLVADALYRNEVKADKDVDSFFNDSKKWIKHHVA